MASSRSNEKLPRGNHLVIKVGPMFYRGIETRPIYRDVWVWGTGKTRKVIDRYDKIYQLVESMDEAKPFRKLSQAKAIGEKLNRHYSGITKIEIIDQGGKRVYS